MKPRLEKESFKTLDKPESFAHAQEIEKETVLFAKEVFLYSGVAYNNQQWILMDFFCVKTYHNGLTQGEEGKQVARHPLRQVYKGKSTNSFIKKMINDQ